MRRVYIPAELERRLRHRNEFGCEEEWKDAGEILSEIVNLLDAESERAARSKLQVQGLGYKELVALLRSHLGSELAVPPKPGGAFVPRIVNRAREMGVDSSNVEQAIRGLRTSGGPPYRLAELIYNYDKYHALGGSEAGVLSPRGRGVVFTGRADFDTGGENEPE